MDFNLMKILANAIGAQEPAFRLLFSILMVYPMAWYYRKAIRGMEPTVQNIFFVLCGLGIGFFNFGLDVYHAVIAVLFTYLSHYMFGPTKFTVTINFFFHMAYLLIGYWVTNTDTYDIKWTMPHCVLVLRLIGLCLDLLDGSKPLESLSVSNRETMLRSPPALLEILSHVFFPASFLVGPQFPMRRYQSFAAGKLEEPGEPSCHSAGSRRALIGLLYLASYQMGTLYFPDDYFLTDAFDNTSFIKKHLILGIWGKIALCKYVSCWLLTEGACITFGIAYNGRDKETNMCRWDGCRNIDLAIYEGGNKFGLYPFSFNINTNKWVAQYVYKRMAFLGSRQVSQVITLAFLAIWHGMHSGYYMTFFMEFMILFMEREVENILKKYDTLTKFLNSVPYKYCVFVILKLYVAVFMGYCLIPFSLLNFPKWWQVYKSLYFSGFILFLPWMFAPVVRMLFKSKPKSEN